ncbi:hypothetical protein NKG94_00125 [Micromonospora sp. M12]
MEPDMTAPHSADQPLDDLDQVILDQVAAMLTRLDPPPPTSTTGYALCWHSTTSTGTSPGCAKSNSSARYVARNGPAP